MLARKALQDGLRSTAAISLSRTRSKIPWSARRNFGTIIHGARHQPSLRGRLSIPARRRGFLPGACCRRYSLSSLPAVLAPPLVFAGLVITLWAWKCMMMVVFQDKIIYMPSVPPFARSESMEDYLSDCKPVFWETRHIRSLDGTKLAICCGSLPTELERKSDTGRVPSEVIICYFQGNGGSLPPRLPLLSVVLKAVAAQAGDTIVTLVALSPRGYWRSSGRATQSGIELDAQALLDHVVDHYAKPGADLKLVLWGQSIGAGVATSAAAAYSIQSRVTKPAISGLVLETPFTSIRSMLVALYPQKWLPYRHLWPFLWNHWDSEAALKKIANTGNKPDILVLAASKDEVVPPEEAFNLERFCEDLGLDCSRKNILGALHHQASAGREGQNAIAQFISTTIRKSPP